MPTAQSSVSAPSGSCAYCASLTRLCVRRTSSYSGCGAQLGVEARVMVGSIFGITRATVSSYLIAGRAKRTAVLSALHDARCCRSRSSTSPYPNISRVNLLVADQAGT